MVFFYAISKEMPAGCGLNRESGCGSGSSSCAGLIALSINSLFAFQVKWIVGVGHKSLLVGFYA